MNPTEARHFLHGCNDELELGVTPDLERRIRAARAIVQAEDKIRRPAPLRQPGDGDAPERQIVRLGTDKDAFNIVEFCQRHGLSRASFYNLEKAGQAPRIMRVGARVMVSKEAAADWRRERETVAAKPALADERRRERRCPDGGLNAPEQQ